MKKKDNMECFVLCNAYKGERCGLRRKLKKNGKCESKTCGKTRCLKWKEGFKVLD